MSNPEISSSLNTISLRKSLMIYTVLLIGLIILAALAPTLAVIFYFLSGFILNRVVLRRLIEWHPIYNTLHNVSSAKLRTFLLWPLAYISLFFRLIINKIL